MILVALAVAGSLLACGGYLILARRWRLLALPSARSAHRHPIPHGGGVPLMLVFFAVFLLAGAAAGPWPGAYSASSVLAAALVLAGIVDDLCRVPVWLRLAFYALCCAAAVWLLRAVPPTLGTVPAVLVGGGLCVALLWFTNLYNFMDGIDAIAASQCVFLCAAAAGLAGAAGAEGYYVVYCLLLAGAQLGFLAWNWPPARLFMGDAGSVPTGFLVGALALQGVARGFLPPACWLILPAVFVTDATWTLLWRLSRGERVTEAHSSHLYQRLARRWGSHRRVVLAVQGINLLWLLPLAGAAVHRPELGPALVILAYSPLLFGMAKFCKVA